MNVLDVAENSVAAGAALIEITLCFTTQDSRLVVTIKDNGKGIPPQMLAQITDPFVTSRKTRKVGLGLPLFKMAAELTGGSFAIESEVGVGTLVRASFVTGHIDLAPLGDMAGTVSSLIQCNPERDFIYTVSCDGDMFRADTRELRAVLDGVSFAQPEIALWVKEYLAENTEPILKRSNAI
ncbi:MAG: ATP-binding protein [Ruthenibacterium sp.]